MANYENPEQVDGLICAYLLDGAGGGRQLDWAGVRAWKPAHGAVWIHLDRTQPGAQRWIREESGLDHLAVEAMLTEETDAVTRYVEDLDAMRERAGILRDEAMSHLSERLNRNMYVLSIVATIMLPLSLLAGLLGINVGGIPGARWPWSFAVVCVLMGALGIVEYWLFRRLRWL